MVADMETHGPIDAAEASAALASVKQSRTRVAWTGYPTWYWLATATGLAMLTLTTLLPLWLGMAGVVVIAALLTRLTIAVSRTRGVCEYWTRSAMRWQEVVLLYGPTVVVLVAGAFMAAVVWWSPIVAAALGFVLFTGTGLMLSARAARR
jgi:hypothetical protein